MSKLEQGCRVTHTKSYRLRVGESEWHNDKVDRWTYLYVQHRSLLGSKMFSPENTR